MTGCFLPVILPANPPVIVAYRSKMRSIVASELMVVRLGCNGQK